MPSEMPGGMFVGTNFLQFDVWAHMTKSAMRCLSLKVLLVVAVAGEEAEVSG